jgi:hypothetical protein
MPRSAQPEIAARLRSYRLHVPNFAPVFHWLTENAGLSSEEIAAAFRIRAARVRAIRSRNPYASEGASLPGPLDGAELTLIDKPYIVIPSQDLRHELGIAAEPDFVVMSKRRKEEIRRFEQEIESDYAHLAAQWMLEDGLARMRRHIGDVGQPQSALLIRILARLRHHSAWFLLHLGRTRSAIDQARRAMALSSVAFHESGYAADRLRIADTGLVLSMAYLLRNQPKQSLRVLSMVHDIHKESGTDPGAEYHRQRGTALLLNMEDAEAEREFVAAGAKMKRCGYSEQMVLLYGQRQLNLLNRPNWHGSLETLAGANTGLTPDELLYQMNVHWAVVAGLATGDSDITDAAIELLGTRPPVSFGHQATIQHLLEVTPRLRLSGETLKRWARYLMYANVFRDE